MPRQRKCKSCRAIFAPRTSTQVACSWQCAQVVAEQKRAKAEARARREAKVKAKTLTEWLRDAQTVFNRWIRLRDAGRPCISCGRIHTGQIHAGHYRSTKAAPHLRFDEDNCHSQCAPDNTYLSGNVIGYRRGLIERIGLERVEAIECDNRIHRWTIAEAREIIETYKRKIKEAAT